MLDGELSKIFNIEQRVPQGCTLSSTLFQVFINDLLHVVEAVGKKADRGNSVSGMLFSMPLLGCLTPLRAWRNQCNIGGSGGVEELAVVDQYTYLGVEIAKDCSWNAHMSKRTRTEYAGEVWEGNKEVVKELETAQMKAAKVILGCSKCTSDVAVRAELGIRSLRSGRDARRLTWQHRMCGRERRGCRE
ncbi:unnamed protein product [Ectocarpus sp. CCAP 1310/34]|nr:unnamed protein product [Ectocarpus sp. CCAP 1310/34]